MNEKIKRSIRWGMVGGGIGGFIGESHRMAARLDGKFNLVAGALSSDAERARESAAQCFISAERTYTDYREMAKAEAARPDGIEAVSIVTPNASHHAIASAFLDHGIAVICDKPLATSVQDGQDLVARAAKAQRLLGVTYNYSGYPMIRHARSLVAEGAVGALRLVQVEFALGWLAAPLEQEGVKQAWRTDPASAGPSGVVADIGTHAYHLLRFVTGLEIETLAADLATVVPGRKLEDNANILLRFKGGARGVLWASMVAAGETVGFRLRVYGETGHLAWDEAFPDQLHLRLLDGTDQTLHRGGKLSPAAKQATRLVSGLPEGFIEAFANLYGDYAEQITARRDKRPPDPASLLAPTGADGVDALAFVEAVLKSGLADGSWVALG
ncbi:Gfo/Idh/MocA family protein [Taklimakanibacter lacteus]|uniref:Gfo/Idh/MocA family protein n=1 Tax=Taklimakanibacter lacteus TaxID=2268456 RepID=UPI0034D6AF25